MRHIGRETICGSHNLKIFKRMKMFLLYCNYWDIKFKIARQGYDLNILINDPEWEVREEVAHQGYRLDKLINDPHWRVRYEVARQGYRLDILINDPHISVRHVAETRSII